MSDLEVYANYGALMLAIVQSAQGEVNVRPRPNMGNRREIALQWEIACIKVMGYRRWKESREKRFGKLAEEIRDIYSKI